MSFESVPVGSWSSGVSLLKKVLRKKGQKSIHQLTIEQQCDFPSKVAPFAKHLMAAD